jgi:hypothetical protein
MVVFCLYVINVTLVTLIFIDQREVLGKTDRLLSWIQHGPHRKRLFQQFFHYCMCIRCCGNVLNELLPSSDRRIHMQTQRLIGDIYEAAANMSSSAMMYIQSFVKIG